MLQMKKKPIYLVLLLLIWLDTNLLKSFQRFLISIGMIKFFRGGHIWKLYHNMA